MNNFPSLRQTALAVASLAAALSALAPDLVLAADKAKTKAAGTYVTGDFHNHTTCSDGSISMQKLVKKSTGTGTDEGVSKAAFNEVISRINDADRRDATSFNMTPTPSAIAV